MKRITSSLATYLAGFILVLFAACDTFKESPIATQEGMAELLQSSVEDFSLTPSVNKSGQTEYVVKMKFSDDDRRLRLPDGINILARRRGTSNVVIYDNGKGFDKQAHDGVYSGVVSEGCVPPIERTGKEAGKKLDITCTIEFVGPGKECGEFGTCPERVHRSWLWGLVEYDTDILFCVCIVECEVTKD